jgi:hypothetical protein
MVLNTAAVIARAVLFFPNPDSPAGFRSGSATIWGPDPPDALRDAVTHLTTAAAALDALTTIETRPPAAPTS